MARTHVVASLLARQCPHAVGIPVPARPRGVSFRARCVVFEDLRSSQAACVLAVEPVGRLPTRATRSVEQSPGTRPPTHKTVRSTRIAAASAFTCSLRALLRGCPGGSVCRGPCLERGRPPGAAPWQAPILRVSPALVGTGPHLQSLLHYWRLHNNNAALPPSSASCGFPQMLPRPDDAPSKQTSQVLVAACLRSVTLLLRPTWLPVLAVARRRTPKRRYRAAGAFATAWRGLSHLESRPRLGPLGSLGSEGCARWTTGP